MVNNISYKMPVENVFSLKNILFFKINLTSKL